MPVLPMEVLTLIVLVEGLAVVFLGIAILSARSKAKSLEELLKIALGEVDVIINMGDHIKKHRKKILENNIMRTEPGERTLEAVETLEITED